MRERTRKIIFLLSVFLVAVIAGGTAWVAMTLRKSIPPVEGDHVATGIEAPVDITYDAMGIPQVWATSERDACFALGWLHASDRLFQMDLTRRLSEGRLSELLGDFALDIDKQQRTVGHHRLAKKALPTLNESNRQLLQAYADGINAYATTCSALPFEYYLLGEEFEKWTVFDCLSILSFQTWYANFLQNNEETFLNIVDKVGPDKARSLILRYPDWSPVTVPEDSPAGGTSGIGMFDYVNLRTLFCSAVVKGLTQSPLLPHTMSLASNGWVVSPHKSASGKAMIASDPHLELTRLPQFWYAAGIHDASTGSGAVGVTTPGLPYVIMGHNSKAAWCFTVGGVDVIDYYHETINPLDSTEYLSPTGWKPFETVAETIHVRGSSEPTIERVRITDHGPIVRTAAESVSLYAARWAGFDVSLDTSASSGFALMHVDNIDSFRSIVTHLGALDVNWMYADSGGNICYQLGTPLPIRPLHAVGTPLSGSDSTANWRGYRPLDETPHIVNPQRGWLATCNNKSSRAGFPIPGNYALDRIMRISGLLDSSESLTANDMRTFQMDDTNVYFLTWKQPLANALHDSHHDSLAANIESWSGSCSIDSREAPIMMAFLYHLKKRMFSDEIGDLSTRISTGWLDQIFRDTVSDWFDDITTDTVIETRADCARLAATDAVISIAGKSLGEVQSVTMSHPFANIPLLGSLLDLSHGPWPRSGSPGTLNASFSSFGEKQFNVVAGPSWRFVLDFANIDSAQMVIPCGNSGHPMSSSFMNFISLWQNGEYWTLPFSGQTVRSRAVRTISLLPQAPIQ